MKEKSLKSYGEKTDKSMKTVMRLLRVAHILNNKTELFLSKHTLTFNQFKVLEVLYHKGDLNISSITKLIMGTPGNTTVVVKNLHRDGLIESLDVLDDYELKTLYDLLNKIYKEKKD